MVRRTAKLAAGLLVGMVILTSSSAGWGQDDGGTSDGAPAGDDAALSEDLEAELAALMDEMGISGDPADLIGEPGDLDLPPGEPVYLGLVTAAEDEPLPDGGGSKLTGPCMGVALSFDDEGSLIDAAADFDDAAPPVDLIDGGQAFTAANAYEVHVDGWVVYAGRADPAPIDHSWYIKTLGVSLDSGGDDNPDAENRNAGSVDLGGTLPAPAKVNALFYMEGEMTADGGFLCEGSGYWATVGGAPALEGAGLVLLLLGGAGLLFNARPARTWRA